jgi:hypothetical protein
MNLIDSVASGFSRKAVAVGESMERFTRPSG